MTTSQVTGNDARDAARVRLHGERSTAVFRTLLDAISAPGVPRPLPAGVLPGELPAALLMPLALGELGTAVAIEGAPPSAVAGCTNRRLADIVHLATSAPVVPVEQAALVVSFDARPSLVGRLPLGLAEAPEQAAKLAVQVQDLRTGVSVRLSGPGVPAPFVTTLGLDLAFVWALRACNVRPPAGIDTWLFDHCGHVLALPRSTRVELLDQTMFQPGEA